MKFYTTFEVADILKVTERTIRKWINEGKLEAARLGGTKTVRVSGDDLNRFLNANRIVATEKE